MFLIILVIMSKAHSPTVFNGEADNFYDPNFTLDINKRMRVPKSIRVSGDYTEEEIADTNGSSWNQIVAGDKFEMHVPDRILVVGKYIIFCLLINLYVNCYITKLIILLKIYFTKSLIIHK